MDTQDRIPYGHCQCGCGGKTTIATADRPERGYVKGEPLRFMHGHGRRKYTPGYRVNPDSGCWEWTGFLDHSGYGRISVRGHRGSVPAYRVVYEQARGPIPQGLQIDHLCRNPRCVNPDHLEPVTRGENLLRGWNSRGRTGTVRQLASRRWRAVINFERKNIHIGMYDTPEEARTAIAAFLAEKGAKLAS